MSNVVTGPKGYAERPTTMLAGAAVTRARAVKRGADADSCVPGTANSVNLGIALEDQDTVGRPVAIVHWRGALVEAAAGAAFALDALLASDANGRLVTATSGQNVTAVARQAATALSQLVVVEIAAAGRLAP
jgi:hypothetical protein